MNVVSAVILGIVQGLTEFLPVSSSGHLVLAEALLPKIPESGVVFEVFLHFGTMISVLVYFRARIVTMLKDNVIFLVIGTIPAGLVGVLFSDGIEKLFGSTTIVGVMLIVTGVINYLTDKTDNSDKPNSPRASFLVGIAQSIAIIPGISRSGSTIFASSKCGMSRKNAAEFSFLLSIPAILGANAVQILKYGVSVGGEYGVYVAGVLSASFAGYVAIGVLLKALQTKNYRYFGYYCIALGVVSLILI